MAAKNGITWHGLRRFRRAFNDKAFQSIVRNHVGVATGQAAHFMQREIRRGIKAGVPPKNAALTVSIKGSSKPLVDFGDLWQSITAVQQSWNLAFAGVLRQDPRYNIALALHDGRTIPVTRAMRGLFFVLWLASKAREEGTQMPTLTGRAKVLFERYQDWAPLSADTRAIKIPARPFIERVVTRADVRDHVRKLWEQAVSNTLRDLARG